MKCTIAVRIEFGRPIMSKILFITWYYRVFLQGGNASIGAGQRLAAVPASRVPLFAPKSRR
jgi:hypothetical protein